MGYGSRLSIPGMSSPSMGGLGSPSPIIMSLPDSLMGSPGVSRSSSGPAGRPPLSGGPLRNASFPLGFSAGSPAGSIPFMRPLIQREITPTMGPPSSMASPGKAMSPRITLASPTPYFRGDVRLSSKDYVESAASPLPGHLSSPGLRSQASPVPNKVMRMTSAPVPHSPTVVRMSSPVPNKVM